MCEEYSNAPPSLMTLRLCYLRYKFYEGEQFMEPYKNKGCSSRQFQPIKIWTSTALFPLTIVFCVSIISAAVTATFIFVCLKGGLFCITPTAYLKQVLKDSKNELDHKMILAAAKVKPAVVSIINNHGSNKNSLGYSEYGSGIIFKVDQKKAYVLTNYHVVEDAIHLQVITADHLLTAGRLIGKDRVTDIALLCIEYKGKMQSANIGNSNQVKQGQVVLAIGNPLGFGGTLTSGIVSCTSRVVPVSLHRNGVNDWEQNVIQTDVPINRGNSGGPLFNLQGEVIGVNTSKISATGVEGLSFALPSNEAIKSANDLLYKKNIIRPFIGVQLMDIDQLYSSLDQSEYKKLNLPAHVKQGAIVIEISGPAIRAGLKVNDVITTFNDKKITSTIQLHKMLFEKKAPGDKANIGFYRRGKQCYTSIILDKEPDL